MVAEIVGYPESPQAPIEVRLLKVLGSPDDPRTEVEKTLACADISEEFPAEVAREVDRMPAPCCRRTSTIGPTCARCPSPPSIPKPRATSTTPWRWRSLPRGGHRLWVAVADVSHYLREGTALDHEAQARGVSVYLPNRAIPMLPEALSGHLCSLVPGEDRLAMVVRIDYDRSLAITEVDFCAAVIHSHGRLDYPGVAAALAGDVRGKRKHYEPFLPSLRAMDALARKLRLRRQERGALDLDLPQVVVELDHDDPRLVRDVRRARRDPGERHAYAMIEEFMLAANEAVGDSFRRPQGGHRLARPRGPRRGEGGRLRRGGRALRHQVRPRRGRHAAWAGRGAQALARPPRGKAAVLPAPARAQASHLRRGQRGPLRPGLARVLALHLAHPPLPRRRSCTACSSTVWPAWASPREGFRPWPETDMPASEILQRAATHASFCERKAMEVEREVVDLYRAFFMRERVGDVLEGSITGVTSFGVFVVMDEPFVEGLVRTDYLAPDDFYDFDEIACRLIGRRSGKTFSLGDRVKVEVLQVSVARRRIEFAWTAPGTAGPRGKRSTTRSGQEARPSPSPAPGTPPKDSRRESPAEQGAKVAVLAKPLPSRPPAGCEARAAILESWLPEAFARRNEGHGGHVAMPAPVAVRPRGRRMGPANPRRRGLHRAPRANHRNPAPGSRHLDPPVGGRLPRRASIPSEDLFELSASPPSTSWICCRPDSQEMELLEKLDGRIKFELEGRRRRRWSVDAAFGRAGMLAGRPRTTVRIDAGTCEKLAARALNPLQALLAGRLRVEGDKAFAMQVLMLLATRVGG